MPCIYNLLKHQDTYCAEVEQTVLETAQAMVQRNIGAVPVVSQGRLVGVFSERDLMRRVVVEGLDPRRVRVGEVMTRNPFTVAPREETESCRVLMHRHGFRHLPVCDGAQVVGMISLRDILLHDLTEKDDEISMMRAYISTP